MIEVGDAGAGLVGCPQPTSPVAGDRVWDLDHLVRLAGDPARHERLLEQEGSAAAALSKVRAALQTMTADGPPDAGAALLLAALREELTAPGTWIPAELPEAWGLLGRWNLATGLAWSMPPGTGQVEALLRVGELLVAHGQREQAAELMDRAREAAQELRGGRARRGLVSVATALASAGLDEMVVALAGAVTDRDLWREVAVAVAAAGQPPLAERIIRAHPDSDLHERVLMRAAEAMAARHPEEAAALAGSFADPYYAAIVARSLAAADHRHLARVLAVLALESVPGLGPYRQAGVLRTVTATFILAGADQEAAAAFGRVMDLSAGDSVRQSEDGWSGIALAWAATGQFDQATQFARSIWHPAQRREALTGTAGRMAVAGDALRAAETARLIEHPEARHTALALVAGQLGAAGKIAEAVSIARSIEDGAWEMTALASAASGAARAGHSQRALDIARMVTVPFRRAEANAAVAAELARRGDHDEAADAIGQIDSPVFRPAALACLACALARAGRGTEAAGTAREAEEASRAVSTPVRSDRDRQHAAAAFSAAGLTGLAEAAAQSVADPRLRSEATRLVEEHASGSWTGINSDSDEDDDWDAEDEDFSDEWDYEDEEPSPATRARRLTLEALDLHRQGRDAEAAGTAREAEDAAHAVGDAVGRAAALASAAEALARSGETDRARRAVVEACVDGHWHDALLPALLADPDAAGRVIWYLGIRASDDGTATAN